MNILLAQIDLTDPAQNPIARFDSIATFLNVIIPFVTIVAGLAFFVMLLYGAITYLTGGGDAEKIKKANKILGFSILGFFIMVFSYFFVKLISKMLNVQTPLP